MMKNNNGIDGDIAKLITDRVNTEESYAYDDNFIKDLKSLIYRDIGKRLLGEIEKEKKILEKQIKIDCPNEWGALFDLLDEYTDKICVHLGVKR